MHQYPTDIIRSIISIAAALIGFVNDAYQVKESSRTAVLTIEASPSSTLVVELVIQIFTQNHEAVGKYEIKVNFHYLLQ